MEPNIKMLIKLSIVLAIFIPVSYTIMKIKSNYQKIITENEVLQEYNDTLNELVDQYESKLKELTTNGLKAQYMTFTVTAYDDCEQCQGIWVGHTSTGATPTPNRTIAVDPNLIPYGSLVIMDGVMYVAEDTGGSIKGNRLDVFVGSHEEAVQFGKQEKEAIVIFLGNSND